MGHPALVRSPLVDPRAQIVEIMMRPKRACAASVDYTDDNNKEQIGSLDSDGSESGDESDCGSDREFDQAQVDRAVVEEQEEEEEAEGEEEDASDWAESDDDEPADDGYNSADSELAGEAAKRPPKSAEELQAEKELAVRLGLSYPEEFRAMRRNLGYLYACLAADLSEEQAVRLAYERIAFPERPTDQERDAIVREAARLAVDIEMPNQVVQETFAALAEHNKGRLVTGARRIKTLVAIVCMVRQVIKLPEYKRAGSVQALGFAILVDVFGNGFSNGEAAVPLGEAYVTDTPLDSAMAHGRADVVARFNAMENKVEVLQMLFGTLANLGDDADTRAAMQAAVRSASRPKYDRSLFDKTPTKGVRAYNEENGLVTVAVHVLVREGPAGYSDAGKRALESKYGALATPFHASYPQCTRFAEVPPEATQAQRDKARRKATRSDGTIDDARYWAEVNKYAKANVDARHAAAPPKLVVTHRNEVTLAVPGVEEECGEALIAAAHKLVTDTTTKLGAFLAVAVPGMPRNGLDHGHAQVHLAVIKNGGRLRLGKGSRRGRNVCPRLRPRRFYESAETAATWVSLHGVLEDEVTSVCFPPWHAYTPGTWDLYLLVGTAPKDRIVHAALRAGHQQEYLEQSEALARGPAEDAWRRAHGRRLKSGRQQKKRKCSPEEKVALNAAMDKAAAEAKEKTLRTSAYRDILNDPLCVWYAGHGHSRSGSVWPIDHLKSLGVGASGPPGPLVRNDWETDYSWARRQAWRAKYDAQVAQRAAWKAKSDEWFKGRAHQEHAAAAAPDGADAAQAEASFAATAAATAAAAE